MMYDVQYMNNRFQSHHSAMQPHLWSDLTIPPLSKFPDWWWDTFALFRGLCHYTTSHPGANELVMMDTPIPTSVPNDQKRNSISEKNGNSGGSKWPNFLPIKKTYTKTSAGPWDPDLVVASPSSLAKPCGASEVRRPEGTAPERTVAIFFTSIFTSAKMKKV